MVRLQSNGPSTELALTRPAETDTRAGISLAPASIHRQSAGKGSPLPQSLDRAVIKSPHGHENPQGLGRKSFQGLDLESKGEIWAKIPSHPALGVGKTPPFPPLLSPTQLPQPKN